MSKILKKGVIMYKVIIPWAATHELKSKIENEAGIKVKLIASSFSKNICLIEHLSGENLGKWEFVAPDELMGLAPKR